MLAVPPGMRLADAGGEGGEFSWVEEAGGLGEKAGQEVG